MGIGDPLLRKERAWRFRFRRRRCPNAFQHQLITAIGRWESTSESDRDNWERYEHWLRALEHTVIEHALIEPEELAELPR
jgi:hypothetical protein